jgi:hypothetical protein
MHMRKGGRSQPCVGTVAVVGGRRRWGEEGEERGGRLRFVVKSNDCGWLDKSHTLKVVLRKSFGRCLGYLIRISHRLFLFYSYSQAQQQKYH